MLIALSECVSDLEIAKDGLRKVMWNFVKSIGSEQELAEKTLCHLTLLEPVLSYR